MMVIERFYFSTGGHIKAIFLKKTLDKSIKIEGFALKMMTFFKEALQVNRKSYPERVRSALFHAMRAVLAFDEIDMKHHSGIISEFRRRYIKTGIFETRMSEIISVLFDVRTDSDYDDFFVISKADTAVQIENAEYFVSSVRAYLKNKEW